MSCYDEKPWLKFYDPAVPPEIEIPDKTYVDLITEGMRAKPARAALCYMGRIISYQDLDQLSARFANYLHSKGCGPGAVVGLNMPNIPQYPIALIGALRAGCTVTGISPLLTPKELKYQLNDCGAKVLVIMDMFFERLMEIKADVPELKQVVSANAGDYLPFFKKLFGQLLGKIPSGKVEPISGKEVVRFPDVMASFVPLVPAVEIKTNDTCLIQYTGGTTGLPKGTELTHQNLVADTTMVTSWVDFNLGEDLLCSGFPFFHLAGLAMCMVTISTSNTQILIPDPRDTTLICKSLAKYKPTALVNVPTLYQMMMDNPRFAALDFSGVKVCLSGAAPFSAESIHALESIVGLGKVVEVYGMTETSPLMTMNPYNGIKKIGSIGIPLPNTRIKLMDVETGTKEVPLGEAGELIVNGPQVMKCYHNKPEETEHAKRELQGELWLYTGDVAKMDQDGFFYIVDRTKDMLNVGGYKVFSREVEETLYQFEDIEFCAIVGEPHPDRPGSDIVKAVIQLNTLALEKDRAEIEKNLRAYCKKNMAPYKAPKKIEFVEAIPLTAVGKVDKKVLR